jgi:hypothetical protein
LHIRNIVGKSMTRYLEFFTLYMLTAHILEILLGNLAYGNVKGREERYEIFLALLKTVVCIPDIF